jgi:hypothetical protein
MFPQYILPAIKPFASDRNPIIRSAYAQCIATFAEAALLFLEMFELFRDNPEFDLDTNTTLYNVTFI